MGDPVLTNQNNLCYTMYSYIAVIKKQEEMCFFYVYDVLHFQLALNQAGGAAQEFWCV